MSEIAFNSNYEILTPTDWQNFDGIRKSKKQTLKIKFQSGKEVICTPDHRFIHDNIEITAKSLKVKSKLGNEIVVSVKLDKIQNVYDPINVANGSKYLSKNIISHNCLFNGSSYTLINAETIGQLSYSTPLLSDSGLDIYEYPIHRTLDSDHKVLEYEHGYILVADTSKGVGGDYSAFTVIDITQMPYRIVAKYRDNTISPLLYPSIIYKVARQYNNAFVLLEINFSDQVAHILYSDYEYENILFVTKDNTQQRISNGFAGASTALGVSTDKKVKRIGCSNFKALIEEKKLLIPDADIISELSTFIQVKDSYAADEGYNDDLVMTLVLFGWLTTSMFFKEVTDMNLRQALYQERIQKIEDDFLPILRDDGIDSGIYHDTKDVWFDYGVFNSNIYK